MLVIIKNAPDTMEGKRAIKLATDMSADLVLIQNGVYFIQKGVMESFTGSIYALGDDLRLRGLKDEDVDKRTKVIDYDDLVDLMVENEKVMGVF